MNKFIFKVFFIFLLFFILFFSLNTCTFAADPKLVLLIKLLKK